MFLSFRFLSSLSCVSLLGLSACQTINPALSDCQKLLGEVQRTVNEAQSFIQDESVENVSQSFNFERWLQAADTLSAGAEAIAQLRLRDAELQGYQTKISAIYQQQAEATYAMVKARQEKDLSAAQAAQSLSQTAGEQESDTGTALDSYCQAQYQDATQTISE